MLPKDWSEVKEEDKSKYINIGHYLRKVKFFIYTRLIISEIYFNIRKMITYFAVDFAENRIQTRANVGKLKRRIRFYVDTYFL